MEKFAIWLMSNIGAAIVGFGIQTLICFSTGFNYFESPALACAILLGFAVSICFFSSIEDGEFATPFGFVMMYIFMGAAVLVSVLMFINEHDPIVTIFWLLMPIIFFLWKYVCVSISKRNMLDDGQMVLLLIGALIITALVIFGLGFLVTKFPDVMVFINPIVGGIIFIGTIVLLVREKELREYYSDSY